MICQIVTSWLLSVARVAIKICGNFAYSNIRVVQNFKYSKFVWNLLNYHSFGQKQHIEAEILKIGQHLGMALCDQSFTVYRINVHYKKIDQNDKFQNFQIF